LQHGSPLLLAVWKNSASLTQSVMLRNRNFVLDIVVALDQIVAPLPGVIFYML
jgi:hypothetical protein